VPHLWRDRVEEAVGPVPLGGRGCKPGAQRVAGVAIRVEPSQPAGSLHDQGHRLLGEPRLG
jgi:hypothetical protein